jgi:2,5-diketo-D-gluconate reductase B
MHDDIIYGTYPLIGHRLHTAIGKAIDAGYRWFDTAQIYGNEADVGIGLKKSGLARDEFKVTTKIAPTNMIGGRFLMSLHTSLAKLQLDHIDLLLLHFPPPREALQSMLNELAEAQKSGLAREVGISNFPPDLVLDALDTSRAKLSFNQVEFHPLISGVALRAVSDDTGIRLQAYSPLARGAVMKQPVLADIAMAHRKTTAQVALRWLRQQGIVPVVHSSSQLNIEANRQISDFSLSAEDMVRIAALAAVNHRVITKDVIPWAPDWD